MFVFAIFLHGHWAVFTKARNLRAGRPRFGRGVASDAECTPLFHWDIPRFPNDNFYGRREDNGLLLSGEKACRFSIRTHPNRFVLPGKRQGTGALQDASALARGSNTDEL